MSSTISCGKCAGAVRNAAGVIFYLLFEKLYESNMYPREPEWQCVFIGNGEDAIRHVFASASDCQYGSLKSSKGCIKPENYIAAWMRELANPVSDVDALNMSASIRLGNNESQLSECVRMLVEKGFTNTADALRNGLRELKVSEHAGEISVLMCRFSLSRKITVPNKYAFRDKSLSAVPLRLGAAPNQVIPPLMIVMNDRNVFEQDSSGQWRRSGSVSGVIGSFISKIAKLEWMYPGLYKTIPVFRNAVKNAPIFGAEHIEMQNWKVLIDSTCELECKYEKASVNEVTKNLEMVNGYFEIKVTEQNIRQLLDLPSICSTWCMV